MKNAFLILFLFFIVTSVELKSQLAGEVYWETKKGENYINLGPCFFRDSIKTDFIIKNIGADSLQVLPVAPTFIIFASPTEQTSDQFREFTGPDNVSLPLTLNQKRKDQNIVIAYFGGDTLAFPTGRKEANFKLGLVEFNTENLISQDSFFLVVHKTPYYIWGYETEIEFDSVYIRPDFAPQKKWKVKSTHKDNISVESQELNYLSPVTSEPEFHLSEFDSKPVFISKYQEIDWLIDYSPVNEGADSAVLKLNYYPDKPLFPDSVDYAWVKLKGTGVEHNIQIVNANVDFSRDTVYLGDVRVNTPMLINLEIQNLGNLPFGAIQQNVVFENNSELNNNYQIIKALADEAHLQPDAKKDLIIEYTPKSQGIFIDRFIAESDIINRNIIGVPASAREKIIYIKSNVIAPKLKLTGDTIDFGNVTVRSADCPSSKDTLFTISNNGNDVLRISDIVLLPETDFELGQRAFEIMPMSSANLEISFRASSEDVKEYSAKMLIIYNNGGKIDTTEVVLKANGTPPVSGILEMPNIKAQPGRIIEMPIILREDENLYSPASFVNQFRTELTFDETLLRYRNRSSVNTASEGALINIISADYGRLKIEIDNGNDYLSAKDTLIKLYFDTYLGESVSTALSFIESETFLSNDNCAKAVKIAGNINSGLFTLDSICGLEYKAVPRSSQSLYIDDIFPSPAQDQIGISLNMPFAQNVKIDLINSYGIKAAEIINQDLPSGKYVFNYNVNMFPSGAYTLRLQSGLFIEYRTLIISK